MSQIYQPDNNDRNPNCNITTLGCNCDDGYSIRYWYNDPGEQFSHYTNNGVQNLLDRDCWNNKLSDRTFLIEYAPWYNMVYPQNTSLCIVHDSAKVLDTSELNKNALDYFNEYNKSIKCTSTQIPTRKGLCTEKQYIDLCPQSDIKTQSRKMGATFSSHASNNESTTHRNTEQICRGSSYTPYLYQGINRNIDSESKLFGIDYYNNDDTIPNDICPDSIMTNKVTRRNLYSTYYQDDRHIYPNATPKTFHNMTKIINNYPIGVDYHKYNRYIYDAERCLSTLNTNNNCMIDQ